jgi:hypothetical protein
MSDDLIKKLEVSESSRSFATEALVSATLSDLNWKAAQGPLYTDVRDQKLREIDVLAHRVWRYKSKTGDSDTTATVVLAIECKTMRGFNILVNEAPDRDLQFQSTGLAHWLGYSYRDDREKIIHVLEKYQYKRSDIVQILKKMEKACYPIELAKVHKFLVRPTPVDLSFNAFRETNVGTEKDLDNSVLWRAVLALDSCTASIMHSRLNCLLDDIATDANAFEQDGSNSLSVFSMTLERYSAQVWLYHPVIVTDARIWHSSEGSLNEMQVARYVRTDGFGNTNKWFDVVSREHFSSYAKTLAAYYEEKFRLVGGEGQAGWPSA